jgi:hypothetical protein
MKLFKSKNKFVEIADSKISEIKSKYMRNIPLSKEEKQIKGWMNSNRDLKRHAANNIEDARASLRI